MNLATKLSVEAQEQRARGDWRHVEVRCEPYRVDDAGLGRGNSLPPVVGDHCEIPREHPARKMATTDAGEAA